MEQKTSLQLGERGGSPRPAEALWWLRGVLCLALVTGAFAGCSGEEEAVEVSEPSSVASVRVDWERQRTSPGHSRHLNEGVQCSECHDLSSGELNVTPFDACLSCHEDAQAHHGKEANCSGCHQFVEDSPGHPFRASSDCRSCHFGEGPATKLWPGAPKVQHHVDGQAGFSKNCTACHDPHDADSPKGVDCLGCHNEHVIQHGRQAQGERKTEEACLDCHSGHGDASGAKDRCQGCHQSLDPHALERVASKTIDPPRVSDAALFSGGHEKCTTCHSAHDLRASAQSSCRSCHEETIVLAEAKVSQHQSCSNCHDQHDVQRSASSSCSNCHSRLQSDHPASDATKGACIGCHNPHPSSAKAPAFNTSCATCHTKVAHKSHGAQECSSCHQPHHFAQSVADKNLCRSCHLEQSSQLVMGRSHQECSQCHAGLPHAPQKVTAANCASCHEAQLPATTKHEACQTCHEPHSGGMVNLCADCHAAESSSAPRGHQACTSCHQPHSAAPRAPIKECVDCHNDKSGGPHASLDTGCATCHRPHGPTGKVKGAPTPPNCTSCHSAPELPSLHSLTGHQDCQNCHTPHGPRVKAARADCLSCHQNKRNHQPSAATCTGCHLFKPARSTR